MLGMVLFAAIVVHQAYQAGRYPGAKPMPGQFNYAFRLNTLLLEQSYFTSAPPAAIQNWYEDRLGVVTVSTIDTDDCVLLRGGQVWFGIEHTTSLSICQSPAGQVIRVTNLISAR